MNKVVYSVWTYDYYNSVRELLDMLAAAQQMYAIYRSDLEYISFGVPSIPGVKWLDYARPVRVLTPGCNPDAIQKDAYVLIRAFEHPYTSDLFRGTMCLYENVNHVCTNINPTRFVPVMRAERSNDVDLGETDADVKPDDCITYPCTASTVSYILGKILDEAIAAVGDIRALRGLIKEVYISDILHSLLSG